MSDTTKHYHQTVHFIHFINEPVVIWNPHTSYERNRRAIQFHEDQNLLRIMQQDSISLSKCFIIQLKMGKWVIAWKLGKPQHFGSSPGLIEDYGLCFHNNYWNFVYFCAVYWYWIKFLPSFEISIFFLRTFYFYYLNVSLRLNVIH